MSTVPTGRSEASNARTSAESEAVKARSAYYEDTPALLPKVDVFEDVAGITLVADLPGVAKENLILQVEGEVLKIEGVITSYTPENMEAIYAEVQTPRYRRTFTLSRELDATKIDASLKDGVLNLRIPKVEHVQPRKIEVRVV